MIKNYNDLQVLKQAIKEKEDYRVMPMSYYQELTARKALGQKLTDLQKRRLLRLKLYTAMGRQNEIIKQ